VGPARTGCPRTRPLRTIRHAGFSLLELTIVVSLIAVLIVIAIDRIWPLRQEAERVGVATVVGALRSALGLELLNRAVEGNLRNLAELDGANPMDLLVQVPGTYSGEYDNRNPADVPGGEWYFDRAHALLVYRLRFASPQDDLLPAPPHARFRLDLRYRDVDGDGRYAPDTDEIHGLDIQALDPYPWPRWPEQGR